MFYISKRLHWTICSVWFIGGQSVLVGVKKSKNSMKWRNQNRKPYIQIVELTNTIHDLGPLLLTWFNFNLSMDK